MMSFATFMWTTSIRLLPVYGINRYFFAAPVKEKGYFERLVEYTKSFLYVEPPPPPPPPFWSMEYFQNHLKDDAVNWASENIGLAEVAIAFLCILFAIGLVFLIRQKLQLMEVVRICESIGISSSVDPQMAYRDEVEEIGDHSRRTKWSIDEEALEIAKRNEGVPLFEGLEVE